MLLFYFLQPFLIDCLWQLSLSFLLGLIFIMSFLTSFQIWIIKCLYNYYYCLYIKAFQITLKLWMLFYFKSRSIQLKPIKKKIIDWKNFKEKWFWRDLENVKRSLTQMSQLLLFSVEILMKDPGWAKNYHFSSHQNNWKKKVSLKN